MRHAMLLVPVLLVSMSLSALAGEHPRMFFTQADVAPLRQKIQAEPYRSMVAQLKNDAEKTGGWAGEAYDDTSAYHVSLRAQRNAFLYVLTGDEAYAKVARTMVERTIASKGDWANAGAKGLKLYWHAARVATAYDWCYGAKSWDEAFSKTVSKELFRHGQVVHLKGGSEQNTSAASNWQGARAASAGLCYLATDETIPNDALDQLYGRVRRYLQSNLGGANGSGWNSEGLGYNYYPMGNFVGPFAIAMNVMKGKDIRKEVPQISASYWSVYASYVPALDGIRPDFGDDNPGTDGEGTYNQAFYFCKDELKPGLIYLYDAIEGKTGRNRYDATRGGTIWGILFHPGDAIKPVNPMEISAWTDMFIDRGGNGMFTYRNHYIAKDDIVAQFFAKTKSPGGHSGPDALSFRIIGLGSGLAVGGGRYGPKIGSTNAFVFSQNTLYPIEPEKDFKPNNDTGKVVGEPVLHADGSGSVVASAGQNNVGTKNLTRRFFSSFDAKAGAQGVFVLSDTSDNGQFWQLCSLENNQVQATDRGFIVTTPDGGTMQATVLYPKDNLRIKTGTRIRGSGFHDMNKNNYAYCQSDDGDYLVVLTLQPKGKPHPAVSAEGNFSGEQPKGTVKVGGLTVTIDGNTIGQ